MELEKTKGKESQRETQRPSLHRRDPLRGRDAQTQLHACETGRCRMQTSPHTHKAGDTERQAGRARDDRKRGRGTGGAQQRFVRLKVSLLSQRPSIWAFPQPGGQEQAEGYGHSASDWEVALGRGSATLLVDPAPSSGLHPPGQSLLFTQRRAPAQGEGLLDFSEFLNSSGSRASCLPQVQKPDWRFWRRKLVGFQTFYMTKRVFKSPIKFRGTYLMFKWQNISIPAHPLVS